MAIRVAYLLLVPFAFSFPTDKEQIAGNSAKSDASSSSSPPVWAESGVGTGTSSSTAAPVPPVVERIEIRLIDLDAGNSTQETPLIIVDVVKKNGSGVAATIQQAIEQEGSAIKQSEDEKRPKPHQSFLVRLRQPNYHSVSFVPFVATTEEVPIPTAELPTEATSAETETTTPWTAQFQLQTEETFEEVASKLTAIGSNATEDTGTDSPEIGQMVKIVPNPAKKRAQEKGEEDAVDVDAQSLVVEELDEAAILGETSNLTGFGEHFPPLLNAARREIWSAGAGDVDMDDSAFLENLENGQAVEEEHIATDEHEECLANRANLSRDTLKRLQSERRRIVHTIRKMNKQQRELCMPDRQQGQVPYRKCPMWRREKFFLYYTLMRLTYCANHARWPSGKRMK